MTLTRYDHQKGCFVLAGPTHKFKCKCHPDSPFHWAHNTRPSKFQQDAAFRTGGNNLGAIASQRIADQRAQGLNPGAIKGISRDREAEVLRMRTFSQFLKAEPSGKPKR